MSINTEKKKQIKHRLNTNSAKLIRLSDKPSYKGDKVCHVPLSWRQINSIEKINLEELKYMKNNNI